MGSRGRRRERVIEIIAGRDIPALRDLARAEGVNLLMMLDMLTYRYPYDDLMRWRAIEATGVAAALLARDNLDIPREFVRKQFWLMSDESGATAWYAAELAGEVLSRVEALIEDQARPLVYFLDESPFERGAHYSVARISRVAPGFFSEDVSRLRSSLSDGNPYIRFYAMCALTDIGADFTASEVDSSRIDVYDSGRGEMKSGTVADLFSDEYNAGRFKDVPSETERMAKSEVGSDGRVL